MNIIDVRLAASAKNGRPYTFSTAVADAIDGMKPGETREFSAWLDFMGRQKQRAALDAMITKNKGDRRFTCRAIHGGVAITRIA